MQTATRLVLLLCFLHLSCKPKNQTESVEIAYDTLAATKRLEDSISLQQKLEIEDSLGFINWLPHIKEKVLKKSKLPYTQAEGDNMDSYSFGHLFSNTLKHLVVKREHWGRTYIDIFVENQGKFIPVLAKEIGSIDSDYIKYGYTNLNGDDLPDFYILQYPSVGCCRRNVYEVYNFNINTGQIMKEYRFINPTFIPNENLIYQLEYGHPGTINIIKCRWLGTTLDTLEILSPDSLQFRKTIFNGKQKKSVALREVPKEYTQIEDFDWFIDYRK